jgi:hypothetical protein
MECVVGGVCLARGPPRGRRASAMRPAGTLELPLEVPAKADRCNDRRDRELTARAYP